MAFFFLATMLASPAATEQQTAETFLKEIYETFDTHPLRGQQVYEQADRFFVPEVVAAIARYDDRDLPRYTSALYFNPFTDDHAGVASDISIKVIADGGRAVGRVSLTRYDNTRVHGVFDLVRTPVGWRIADITWGSGNKALSMRRLFGLR